MIHLEAAECLPDFPPRPEAPKMSSMFSSDEAKQRFESQLRRGRCTTHFLFWRVGRGGGGGLMRLLFEKGNSSHTHTQSQHDQGVILRGCHFEWAQLNYLVGRMSFAKDIKRGTPVAQRTFSPSFFWVRKPGQLGPCL